MSVQIKRASCPDRPAGQIYSQRDEFPTYRWKKSGMLYVKMFLIYFSKRFGFGVGFFGVEKLLKMYLFLSSEIILVCKGMLVLFNNKML